VAHHDEAQVVLGECRAGEAESSRSQNRGPNQMRFHDAVLPVLSSFCIKG
jgi:hypothetical protein